MSDAQTSPFVALTVEGAIATLTINRPERLNALDRAVIAQIGAAVEKVRADTTLRCLIVTGAGEKAFVAGADIAEMKAMSESEAHMFSREGQDVFASIEALPIPAIAMVQGFALGGGCELALACDFIYASEKAKLGQPEVKLGVIPGFGGTQRLMRRVGAAKARELVYTGEILGAEEALRIGLVNAVFSAAELSAKTRATAASIAERGPFALAQAKRVMLEGEGMPLGAACALEAQAFARCFTTADQKEGMAAFLEKRPPAFKGDGVR